MANNTVCVRVGRWLTTRALHQTGVLLTDTVRNARVPEEVETLDNL